MKIPKPNENISKTPPSCPHRRDTPNLQKVVNAFRCNNAAEVLQTLTPSDQENFKVQALAGIVLEDFWKFLQQNNRLHSQQTEAISPSEIKSHLRASFHQLAKEFIQAVEMEKFNCQIAPSGDTYYNMLKSALAQKSRTIEYHFDNGFLGAFDILGELFERIPEFYLRQFGKAITLEEYDKLSKSTLKYWLKTASLYTDDAAHSIAALLLGEVSITHEPNNSLKLNFHTLEDQEFARSNTLMKTGCPGLVAKSENEKNLIVEMFHYVLEIYKRARFKEKA